MTPKELNRDIKRLYAEYHKNTGFNTTNWTPNQWAEYNEKQAKFSKELQRLYYSDKDFAYLNLYSLKAMLILNRKMRVIPFHQFGIHCEL